MTSTLHPRLVVPDRQATVWWWCEAGLDGNCRFMLPDGQGPAGLGQSPSGCPVCGQLSVSVFPTEARPGEWSCAIAGGDSSVILAIDGFAGLAEAWARARAFVRELVTTPQEDGP
jgi:hypothetical protein